jgi:REP element-mobilizing transposase RayT
VPYGDNGIKIKKMAEKYKNKYRIESHRMPYWDYSGNGVYFLTFVTQNRECNLGIIRNGIMELSGFGNIVNTQFNLSFEIRDELFLDEYIIMPNHLHTIVVLDKNVDGAHVVDMHGMDGTHRTHVIDMDGTHVETHGRASLQQQRQQQQLSENQREFVRKPKSISSFVAGFKSAVNTKIDDYIDLFQLNIQKYNRNNHFFQPDYHDHIIRNYNEYMRIKNYIVNNPLKWNEDSLNK